jgi:hypothetical protein
VQWFPTSGIFVYRCGAELSPVKLGARPSGPSLVQVLLRRSRGVVGSLLFRRNLTLGLAPVLFVPPMRLVLPPARGRTRVGAPSREDPFLAEILFPLCAMPSRHAIVNSRKLAAAMRPPAGTTSFL